jgi:hypothetical protein
VQWCLAVQVRTGYQLCLCSKRVRIVSRNCQSRVSCNPAISSVAPPFAAYKCLLRYRCS